MPLIEDLTENVKTCRKFTTNKIIQENHKAGLGKGLGFNKV